MQLPFTIDEFKFGLDISYIQFMLSLIPSCRKQTKSIFTDIVRIENILDHFRVSDLCEILNVNHFIIIRKNSLVDKDFQRFFECLFMDSMGLVIKLKHSIFWICVIADCCNLHF